MSGELKGDHMAGEDMTAELASSKKILLRRRQQIVEPALEHDVHADTVSRTDSGS